MVTPTILYELAALPLSAVLLQELEVVQKKMLRKIVGWVRIGDESWEVTMRRMKDRVHRALLQRPIMAWTTRIGKTLWKLILRIREAPNESWIRHSSMWAINELEDPYSDFVPYRSRGRVCLQWDSVVNHFCHSIYNESWQN